MLLYAGDCVPCLGCRNERDNCQVTVHSLIGEAGCRFTTLIAADFAKTGQKGVFFQCVMMGLDLE